MKSWMITAASIVLMASVACKKPPTYFIKGDSSEWKIVDLKEDYDPKHKWQTVVDIVATKLDIETLDETSGYIRTGWKVGYGLRRDEKGWDVYKVRATMKFEPGFKRIRVRTEAIYNNLEGMDSHLLNDIYQDIQGRLGRTVK